jgi:hypothetical protein
MLTRIGDWYGRVLRDPFSAVGAIGGAAIQAGAASSAADKQLQAQREALQQQQSQFNTTQANEAPWLQAGQGALSLLSQGTQPGGSLVTPADSEVYQTPAAFEQPTFNAPAPFTAPTAVDETNDPGYQARMAAQQQALTRAGLASGGAFSGGTVKALQQAGQDYASNEYANVYDRALTGYQTNFGNALNAYNTNTTAALNAYNTNTSTGLQGYQTRFNAANTNQSNQFNRLAALAGLGQTATGQLASAGQAATNNTTSLLTQGGNVAAAGTLGIGSAINNGIQNTANAYSTGSILKMLQNGGGYSSGALPTSYSGYTVTPSSLGTIGLDDTWSS